MTSWLKAAEDLFEVVDRRAKLVVSDLGDEISENNPPASSNGQGSQRAKKKLKAKRLSLNEVPRTSGINAQEQIKKQTSQPDAISATSDNDRDVPSLELPRTTSKNLSSQSTNELEDGFDKEISVMGDSLTNELPSETMKNDSDVTKDPAYFTVEEPATSNSNAELVNDDHPPLPLPQKKVIVENEVHPVEADSAHKTDQGDADYPLLNIDQDKSLSLSESVSTKIDPQSKSSDLKPEAVSDNNQEPSTSPSPSKVQDQLEEAQGLLKITKTTGQSKEARLARVCTGLSSRLQEYKSENAQLEELLVAERELSKSYGARIKQLQKELSVTKMEVTRVESHMGEALAAKNHEIEALVSSLDSIKKQSALSEGNMASLQANMESIMRNRELTETRMIQALREELATAERRVEEERAAHNATKKAAMEREVDLEQRSVDASMALSRIQRLADDRTSKAADLEQKVALLEVECASLNQELQDMEACVRRGQKKSPEDANQVVQAWQDEVERARQGQRDAESKLSALEADVQKLRVEMAAMKRDAEHYSRQEHMELEKRYRELTDLLYYKQTQLESMASEKAAAEFQLEKEIKRGQDTKIEEERIRASRRTSSSWDEDTELKALEPLPLHHRHMVGASMQVQKAAKFLDKGAIRATRFLWRYPIARIIMLFYLVFVHLFLMFLLHHLQEQADQFSSREVAESMGLNVSKLP